MENLRILFITQEIAPYVSATPIASISRELPQRMQENGMEIRTFLPRYGCINERRNQLHEVIRLSGMNMIISDTDHPLIIKVASLMPVRMQVYFIDNEDFFGRKELLADASGVPFDDNDERAIFYARGVLETVRKLRWAPDIVHCLGWFSSLVPLYVRKAFKEDPLFNKSKVVLTLFNDGFDKPFSANFKQKAVIEGVTKKDLSVLDTPDYVSLSKLAVNYSDGIIEGCPGVNETVLQHVLKSRKLFLPWQEPGEGHDPVAACADFYQAVLNNTKK